MAAAPRGGCASGASRTTGRSGAALAAACGGGGGTSWWLTRPKVSHVTRPSERTSERARRDAPKCWAPCQAFQHPAKRDYLDAAAAAAEAGAGDGGSGTRSSVGDGRGSAGHGGGGARSGVGGGGSGSGGRRGQWRRERPERPLPCRRRPEQQQQPGSPTERSSCLCPQIKRVEQLPAIVGSLRFSRGPSTRPRGARVTCIGPACDYSQTWGCPLETEAGRRKRLGALQ